MVKCLSKCWRQWLAKKAARALELPFLSNCEDTASRQTEEALALLFEACIARATSMCTPPCRPHTQVAFSATQLSWRENGKKCVSPGLSVCLHPVCWPACASPAVHAGLMHHESNSTNPCPDNVALLCFGKCNLSPCHTSLHILAVCTCTRVKLLIVQGQE